MQCWWRMLQCKIRFATPAKLKTVSDRKLFQMGYKEWFRLCRMAIINKVALNHRKNIWIFFIFDVLIFLPLSLIMSFLNLSISLSIYASSLNLSISLSISASVSLSACMFICLVVYLLFLTLT